MDVKDFVKVGRSLGLTSQQFDVLQCVYRLRVGGGSASPKAIQEEYRKASGKYLIKPNLFNILRFLKGKGYLRQAGFGEYEVDFDGVESVLQERKAEFRRELVEFEGLADDVSEYFNRVNLAHFKPSVEYLEHGPFFRKIGQMIRQAKRHYTVGKFANIAYTPRLLDSLDRGDCFRTLQDYCLVKKKLKVTYLTCFDVDYLYNQALRAFREPGWAYAECETVLDRAEEFAESKCLDLFYVEHLPGLQLVMPEKPQPMDVFLYTRDNRDEIIGGVYIRSPDIAKRAREMFETECGKAVNLKEPKGKKIMRKVRKELKQRFGS